MKVMTKVRLTVYGGFALAILFFGAVAMFVTRFTEPIAAQGEKPPACIAFDAKASDSPAYKNLPERIVVVRMFVAGETDELAVGVVQNVLENRLVDRPLAAGPDADDPDDKVNHPVVVTKIDSVVAEE